jgi:hypothetical protein
MDLGSGASTPASSFAVGNEKEPIAPNPTPNNTSRLMMAMADRSRGHRGPTIKRKKIRPMLKRVEGDNADRVVELARHEIGNYGFEICPLGFGFAFLGVPPVLGIRNSTKRNSP